jgi:hypothetical protein
MISISALVKQKASSKLFPAKMMEDQLEKISARFITQNAQATYGMYVKEKLPIELSK